MKKNRSQATGTMVYCIACIINGNEYIVMNTGINGGIHAWRKAEEVKAQLNHFYEMLRMDVRSREYTDLLSRLLLTHPVIISFHQHEYLKMVETWFNPRSAFVLKEKIINAPHGVVSVKKGFIEKYEYIDVVRDIESAIVFSEGEGLTFSKFVLSEQGEPVTILTEKLAQQILNSHGL